MNQLSSIIKNHQTVCWYPSAGADLNAINYWNLNLGNKLKPTLFIISDIAYFLKNSSSHFYKDVRGFHKIPEEFDIERITEPINILNFDERLNECKANKILTIQDQEIDLDNYNSFQALIKDTNFKRLCELGIIDNDGIYKYLYNNYSADFDNVTYCYLKKEGIEIILLHASNEEFYNFCLNNSFNINCLMLQRYYNDGYVFEARSESKVVETLKVKEGIVNPNYSSYPIKENNYASFLWKYYGDERDKDKVAYIKYN